MRVKDVLRNLKEYDPNDEIIIQWWDKDHVSLNINKDISGDQWSKIVKQADNDIANGYLGDEIDAIAYETIKPGDNQ